MAKHTPDLSKRLTPAIRDTFTDFGCEALFNVITGRISQSQAIQTLLMLRDTMLDDDGDLMYPGKLTQFFKTIGEPIDNLDLTWHPHEESL